MLTAVLVVAGLAAHETPSVPPSSPPSPSPVAASPVASSSTSVEGTAVCIEAPPKVASMGRAHLTSACGSKDGHVHNGDRIDVDPRGHVRLEATLDNGNALDVICLSGNSRVQATVAGDAAPWLELSGDAHCNAWADNERVCTSTTSGDEVFVCDAQARRPDGPRFVDKPLGLPTWYVGEAPPPEVHRRATRVVVYELQQKGLDDRVAAVVTASVTAELRKLSGLSVLGTDEARTMLDHEAQKQLLGCNADDACLAEIAEALGADVVVTGGLGAIGDQRFFTLKEIDEREAKVVAQVSQRLQAGNGEEFLGVVGPAVKSLFPERTLKPGKERGVAPEIAVRLNPPPFDPWVFWSGVGVTGAVLVGTGVTALVFADSYAHFDAARSAAKAPGNVLLPLQADAKTWGTAAAIGAGATGVLAATTAASAAFVDWAGYRTNLQLDAVE